MFNQRDLTLFLPNTAGDIISLRHTDTSDSNTVDKSDVEQRVDRTKKVIRYRAGQVPVWVNQVIDQKVGFHQTSNDRRLNRLATIGALNESLVSGSLSTNGRRVYEAEVLVSNDYEKGENANEFDQDYNINADDNAFESVGEGENDDNDNSNNIDERRLRMLSRTIAANSSPAVSQNEFNNYDSHDEELDYETDTDDSEPRNCNMLKPVFVPKSHRSTKQELEVKEESRKRIENYKNEQQQQRIQQTRQIVAESIRRNDNIIALNSSDNDDGRPDDADDTDDNSEFNAWKIREMTRLKRDAHEREMSMIEIADLERRRNMSEEERVKEDKALGKFDKPDKKRLRFLQKYYHKGAFFMDEDSLATAEVRKRIFDEPTLEDKFNKELLPQILQVKNFGKRGRTKYTHLADQDTSRKNYF